LKPVKLLNNVGDNICWWNSFAQLFGTTRNLSILNAMIRFINEHDCDDNRKCWYCNTFYDFITIMTNSNNSTNTDFNKYLFNIPAPVHEQKDPNNLIFHNQRKTARIYELFVTNW